MHHTTFDGSSFRLRSAGRRLARGLPWVALAALGVAFGCGSDDDTADRPNADAAGGDVGGGGGTAGAPSDEVTPPVEGPPTGAFVEDNGTDCEIPPLPDAANLPTVTTLPDPFLGLNGERLTSRSQWRCRRQEIKKVAERFIYGEKPVKPESVTGTVTATSITVDVSGPGGSASFTATITLPPDATGPAPAVIGYGGSVFQDAMAQEGVAFINYNIGDVGDETTKSPNKLGAFYAVNPDRQDTGMLVAWSWGVSRMLDVLEAAGGDIINPRGIGVTGCSRSGKGAFIAGAFDERVALTIPLESGMAGVPAFRLIVPEGGEVLRNAYEYRPWAGDAYRQFLSLTATSEADTAGRDFDNQASDALQDLLPVDTHEVIGMVAPRGLLVLGNPGIVNLAPDAEHVTVLAGKEIYTALGVGDNLSYISNTTIGDHCQVLRPEYVPLLQQNLRKFLKGDATAATGEINPDARLMGQLGPNIAWETPTLD
jgi:glucuronyl esterase-like protein